MGLLPGPRDLYNRIERLATPVLDNLMRSEEFAQVVVAVTDVNKALRDRRNAMTARAWHTVNLPAGTDVQRLKVQLGALDREIRLLSLELEKARAKEVSTRGVAAKSARHDRSRPS
ncbi:hypothetical protein BN12_470015 [Nostocoides japonicum T1-X7]|uniref:Uncharacterized protein n=1 Tax=Nostocoides japonicum T1-X7 TaxID=1194083 RepID=A0A077M675_9MICO|nr:hypothetical protein [Tetrasphaera japonica]CCH79545.1 hypothetical protein BN12_470015 [Tetrasphaera japonica T1-X7]